MRDIEIFDIDAVTGKITFNFNKGQAAVRGRKALIQLVTLNLLNDEGSNSYNARKGTNVLSILNGAYTKEDEDIISTLLTLEIAKLEQYIISEQASIVFTGAELDGKLKKLEIFSVGFNASSVAWDVKLLITTAANNIGIVNL